MKHSIAILVATVLLSGCKGDTGPAGPYLTGSISGIVRLQDSSGTRMSDNSGAVISIENTSLTATSSAMGVWTIGSLSTGTYTISIMKPGFDSYKYFGFQFVGGGNAPLYPTYLHQLPTFDVQHISVSSSGSSIRVSGNISSTLVQTVILFWGRDRLISNDPAHFLTYSFFYIPGSTGSFTTFVSPSGLRPGINTGDKAYVVAYPSTNGGWNSYVDPATGRDVITSIRPVPSNIDSVIVP